MNLKLCIHSITVFHQAKVLYPKLVVYFLSPKPHIGKFCKVFIVQKRFNSRHSHADYIITNM